MPLVKAQRRFRKSDHGKWLWPGFGENARVLKWICERVEGTGKAVETPIGWLPTADGLDTAGLDVPVPDLAQLLAVDIEGWKKEALDVAEFRAACRIALELATDP